MLHLHKGELQVLVGHVLTGREEVKAVIWPPGYVTSGVAEVRPNKLRAPEVWTRLNLTLAPGWLPQSHGSLAPYGVA